MAGFIIPAAILAAKAGKAYFGNKAKHKANDEEKRAATAALNTQQKQREDARRGRLKLGASMLSSVPKTTAGGGVSTNLDIDPAILDALGAERTYDFGATITDRNKGAGSAFLSGLFGDVGDTLTSAYTHGLGGDDGVTAPWQDVSRTGANPWANGTASLPGGLSSAPLNMVGDGGPAIDWEDLYRLQGDGAE